MKTAIARSALVLLVLGLSPVTAPAGNPAPVVLLANYSSVPRDTDVQKNGNLAFFNLDPTTHEIKDTACVVDPAVACKFALDLEPFAYSPDEYADGNNVIRTNFFAPGTYAYRCAKHAQLTGSFTVTV